MQIKGFKMSIKKFLISTILAQVLFLGVKAAATPLCPEESKDCCQSLSLNPLFNTDYKISANYVPILPLRGMVQADVYKDKKSLIMDRRYYIKDATGNYGEPYQKTLLNISVKGSGIIGREVIAEGTLNEHKLKYHNHMKFSLPKRANMKVNATLDGIQILELAVQSDGDKMTNLVKGSFLGKQVDYQTHWRETKGTLAGIPYLLHTEGLIKEKENFKAVTKGTIGSSAIKGEIKMLDKEHFESTEYYGPVMVKTKLTILEKKK